MVLSEDQKKHLVDGAHTLGVSLSVNQVEQFARYSALLAEWNEKINLTRVPHAEIVPLHFLDSLTAVTGRGLSARSRLIDVGTGAGFPGIPLKIAFPDLSVTLMDSTRKKLDFLRIVIKELELEEAEVLHLRAEDAGHIPKLRESFTHATARAVAQINVLLELMLPLLAKGGKAIFLKSSQIEGEIETARSAATVLGGSIDDVHEVQIPGTEILRTVVVATKVARTPPKYPRHSGQIKAKPLTGHS